MTDDADTILCPGGESFLLLPAQESLRQAAEMQRTILDAIPAHLAMFDRNGKIIFINESWRRFLGLPEACASVEIGQKYIEYCELADHAFGGMGPKMAAGIRNVLQGDGHSYSLIHQVHQEGKSKWYRVTATSLGRTDLIGAVVSPDSLCAAAGARACRGSSHYLRPVEFWAWLWKKRSSKSRSLFLSDRHSHDARRCEGVQQVA